MLTTTYLGVNPVTGELFISQLDATIERQLADRALLARAWFNDRKPADFPQLPLTYNDRETLKRTNAIGYIVSLFARSLDYRGYVVKGHPDFDTYARGVMASRLTPEFIRRDPDMLQRYPPAALEGLGGGLIWREI